MKPPEEASKIYQASGEGLDMTNICAPKTTPDLPYLGGCSVKGGGHGWHNRAIPRGEPRWAFPILSHLLTLTLCVFDIPPYLSFNFTQLYCINSMPYRKSQPPTSRILTTGLVAQDHLDFIQSDTLCSGGLKHWWVGCHDGGHSSMSVDHMFLMQAYCKDRIET